MGPSLHAIVAPAQLFGQRIRGPEEEKLVRYRLRFVLQELDLPQGVTIIGRSLDCNLTLEDPLVSRRHARIVADATGARIEDLDSRNGVRVNGVAVREPVVLRSGDRVRIGTQDFVFCCVDDQTRGPSRTTGHLRLCANCRLPYPRELLACPTCEATEQTDEDTLTGSDRSVSHAWNVQLMVESLERALRLSRVEDAERIVRRAVARVEELLVVGGSLDEMALAALAMQAVATSIASGDPAWAHWVLTVYGRARRVPPLEVIERLAQVGRKHRSVLLGGLNELFRRIEAGPAAGPVGSGSERGEHAPPSNDRDVQARVRLEELRRTFETDDDGPPGTAPSPSDRQLPTA
jgi:hypothetical protein